MLTLKKSDLGKSTYQFDITIPQSQIAKKYNQNFDRLVAELELPGFRKGKAPKKIAEKHIKKETVYEKLISDLIPEVYQELLKQESLKPIISPKIELIKAKENEDWLVRITVAEKPKIDLKNYKDLIKKLKIEEKKADIWVPGKSDKGKPTTQEKEDNRLELLNKIFDVLIKNTSAEISDLIIETELNRGLSQLVDDVRKVGLTIDQYLKSKQETIESLKEKFKKEITEMYKLEFILEEISEKEKITVEQKDLELFFANIKEEKERQKARENAYFYASILRRQKTLDFLIAL